MRLFVYGLTFLLTAFIGCKKDSGLKEEDRVVALKPSGTLENLGGQLTTITYQGAAFAQDDQGNEYAYIALSGKPAHVFVYDVQKTKVIADLIVGNTNSVNKIVTSSDGWVYFGGSDGKLYSSKPGTSILEDLGQVLPGQSVVLDLTAGSNGEVYGGTYPGGRIFKYTRTEGFSDLGNGPIVSGESYVRSIVYHKGSGKIYAGVGSHARLVEIDLNTNSKKEFLPTSYHSYEFVYSLGVTEGYEDGDRLFVWVTSSADKKTLVYNIKTGVLEKTLSTTDASSLIKSPHSNISYYTAENKLYSQDLTGTSTAIKITDCYEAKDMFWGKDGILSILTKYGQIRKYNPVTGSVTTAKAEVSAQPYDIQTILAGPDGRIWTSGYLSGGNAAFDPKTGRSIEYSGLGQAEGMSSLGSVIYFGIYPGAVLYSYDTSRPWNIATGNPKKIGAIEGQDRPFAVIGVEEKKKVFFGTVPGYGKLGGSLSEYNPLTNQLETFPDSFLENMSIVCMAYKAGKLYLGTTQSGGLGIVPSVRKSAKIIVWDVESKTKVDEIVPLNEGWGITSLTFGPEGNLWGMVDGTIFSYNISTRNMDKQKNYYNINGFPTNLWRNAFLVFLNNGDLYATYNSAFHKINKETLDATLIRSSLGLLTKGSDGNLYAREEQNLWRYYP